MGSKVRINACLCLPVCQLIFTSTIGGCAPLRHRGRATEELVEEAATSSA